MRPQPSAAARCAAARCARPARDRPPARMVGERERAAGRPSRGSRPDLGAPRRGGGCSRASGQARSAGAVRRRRRPRRDRPVHDRDPAREPQRSGRPCRGREAALSCRAGGREASKQRADELERGVDWDRGGAGDLEQFAGAEEHRAAGSEQREESEHKLAGVADLYNSAERGRRSPRASSGRARAPSRSAIACWSTQIRHGTRRRRRRRTDGVRAARIAGPALRRDRAPGPRPIVRESPRRVPRLRRAAAMALLGAERHGARAAPWLGGDYGGRC